MAAAAAVTYEVQDEVAVITLRRPDKLNAVNPVVRDGIIESFLWFEQDDQREGRNSSRPSASCNATQFDA